MESPLGIKYSQGTPLIRSETGAGIESIFAEPSKNFFNVLLVVREVIRVDENIVEVDDNRDIDHIGESVVHEMLECGGSIGKTFRDDQPFKRAIACPKGGLCLVSLTYPD